MILVTFAFWVNFIAQVEWVICTWWTFRMIQRTGYYPYPKAFVGVFLHSGGTLILGIAMYCGITRRYEDARFTVMAHIHNARTQWDGRPNTEGWKAPKGYDPVHAPGDALVDSMPLPEAPKLEPGQRG